MGEKDQSQMAQEIAEQKKEESEKVTEKAESVLFSTGLSFSDRQEKEKVLEAALFMSPKAIPLEELNEIASVNSRLETKAMMEELIGFYRSRKSALEIVELPIGYQMRVKEQYEEKVKHFAQDSVFHKGIMKTLALIAYKQPIHQSLVVQYRNNKAYDHLKVLFENGFIKKEPKGRTYVLTTTTKFIEYFGKDFGKAKKK